MCGKQSSLKCRPLHSNTSASTYLHENLLIEFKHDEIMSDPHGKRAEVLAQACYYCYLLRINEEHVPPYIALVDKTTVIVYQRQHLEHIYKKNAELFKRLE